MTDHQYLQFLYQLRRFYKNGAKQCDKEINRLEQKGVVIERTKELFGDLEEYLLGEK